MMRRLLTFCLLLTLLFGGVPRVGCPQDYELPDDSVTDATSGVVFNDALYGDETSPGVVDPAATDGADLWTEGTDPLPSLDVGSLYQEPAVLSALQSEPTEFWVTPDDLSLADVGELTSTDLDALLAANAGVDPTALTPGTLLALPDMTPSDDVVSGGASGGASGMPAGDSSTTDGSDGSSGGSSDGSSADVGTPSGPTYLARGTGYYPSSDPIEGGFTDRRGAPLHTLQDYLAGRADYVSVAMDTTAFPYGTHVRIPELEAEYGQEIDFRVVDTGGAFRGKGTSRIDICTASRHDSLDATINGPLHIVVVK
jgi:3D (Asp-Asp-Asp) domain-containing protein